MNKVARNALRRAFPAVASAFFALGAHAAGPYYLGVHGGVNDLKDWSADVTLGPGVSLPGTLTLDRGRHFGLMFGRQTENVRFELEAQSGRFDVSAIQLGPVSQAVASGGRYEALTFNAYRTFAFSGALGGYAGLGLGWGRASLPQLGFTSGCNCFAGASGSGTVLQGRLGAEYSFGEHHKAFLQYTWLRLPRSNSGGTPGTDYGRKSVGIAGIGYRYAF